MKIGRKVFGVMKDNSVENRKERVKKAYKDKMWSKVSNWLEDIDKQENTNRVMN